MSKKLPCKTIYLNKLSTIKKWFSVNVFGSIWDNTKLELSFRFHSTLLLNSLVTVAFCLIKCYQNDRMDQLYTFMQNSFVKLPRIKYGLNEWQKTFSVWFINIVLIYLIHFDMVLLWQTNRKIHFKWNKRNDICLDGAETWFWSDFTNLW